MKKGLIIIIVLSALIVAGVIGYLNLTGSSTTPAYLEIKSGQVNVDTGKGWVQAQDGMELSASDKVRTLNGLAAIIFYEGTITRLNENTEVIISQLSKSSVKIKQESGNTWNKFTGVTGTKKFEVKTPTTTATVRGTEFGISTGEEDILLVGEGEVTFKSGNKEFKAREFQKFVKKKGQEIIKKDLTPEERTKILKEMRKTVENLKRIRMREINKKRALIQKAAARYGKKEGVSGNEIDEFLKAVDAGEINTNELIKKVPVKIKAVEKVKKLSDKIREQQQRIDKAQRNE